MDDIIDVLQSEATEDIYRMGAVSAPDIDYFGASIRRVVRRRILWLLLLLVTNTMTGHIIAGQADALQATVALAAFIPLLIGSGGNVGAQSSTVVVRGLEVKI